MKYLQLRLRYMLQIFVQTSSATTASNLFYLALSETNWWIVMNASQMILKIQKFDEHSVLEVHKFSHKPLVINWQGTFFFVVSYYVQLGYVRLQHSNEWFMPTSLQYYNTISCEEENFTKRNKEICEATFKKRYLNHKKNITFKLTK